MYKNLSDSKYGVREHIAPLFEREYEDISYFKGYYDADDTYNMKREALQEEIDHSDTFLGYDTSKLRISFTVSFGNDETGVFVHHKETKQVIMSLTKFKSKSILKAQLKNIKQ